MSSSLFPNEPSVGSSVIGAPIYNSNNDTSPETTGL